MSGAITATSYNGATTSFTNVPNFTVNVDLTTYTLVEIIFNCYPTSPAPGNIYLKQNSGAGFTEWTALFWKNALTTPTINIVDTFINTYGASVSCPISGTIKMYKGINNGRMCVDARAIYNWDGVGVSKVEAMGSANAGNWSTLYFASSGNLTGSYIVRNYK